VQSDRALWAGPTPSAAWADSGRRRTERAGLPPKIDVPTRHEELTWTHVAIVCDIPNKVNLFNR
jgi:predicted protein tyrosine phosphatase